MKKIISLLVTIFLIIGISFSASADDKIVSYEELMNYKQLFDNNGSKGLVPVRIEAVIGNIIINEGNSYFDLWIKGENGYGYYFGEIIGSLRKYTDYPHELVSGQRVIYEITPNVDGSFVGPSPVYFEGADISSFEIIEENVDYKEIEEGNKAMNYEAVSWKSLMRNIDDYKDKRVCVEGVYLQTIKERSYTIGLLMDDESNIFSFVYYPEKIKPTILLNDRIKVYGYISSHKSTYEYKSLTGDRKVPCIWVEMFDLLEEDK